MTLGVTPAAGGADVEIFSAHATRIELCLFDPTGTTELRRIPIEGRTGDIFHAHVPDLPAGTRYGLRAHGPYAPQEGHRFNPDKLLIDPHARTLDRIPRFHPSMCGDRDGRADPSDSAPFTPKCILGTPEAGPPAKMLVPWSETILYELHIRGFTMRHPAIPAPLRGSFAALAHPAAIEHLTRLGVTAVELLPAAAWIEEPDLAARPLPNYWGYNPIALCAPDPRLAPGGWPEIRAATAALEAAGIETIVDVVLNHSGEGDALGPTLSLRGLDNASYYRLADDPAGYANDSGCGNTLALDRPQVLRLAMDSLRAWANHGGVHGFRFDLATTLGRRPTGFDPAAPLLAAIDQDPVLSRLKLIAEPWDIGQGGYRLGAFPGHWGEWNDRFRDDVRRFWRGDPTQLGPLATRLAGSDDIFAAKRRPSRGINFITAHDGFTLADLVAYREKHNEANAEGNRDGTSDNLSWNHGTEGPSPDPTIVAGRARDQRALLATLLFARGTPMLAMGAEIGFSQSGNNNAYCQDNVLTWLDWDRADLTLLAWTRHLTQLRRSHPGLRHDRFLTGQGAHPDVAWREASGDPLHGPAWTAPGDPALVVILACRSERLTLVFNRAQTPADVLLPAPFLNRTWTLLADSAAGATPPRPIAGQLVEAPARAVLLLAETARRFAPAPRD